MKCFLLILLSSWTICLKAQNNGNRVMGNIQEQTGEAIPFVNVMVLKQADSSLVKIAITDTLGNFVLEDIPVGTYFLQALYVGYQKYYGRMFELQAQDFDAGAIQLLSESKQLKEISVVAIKPFIEHQFDKTIVNVENSIVNAGSTAMEILSRAPGVMIAQDESILLKGKSGTLIMIDGKPSVLAGDALVTYLRSIPSASLSKIEIITNPSAKYDAAGTGGIINIILKKDKRQGTNGTLSGSYGQGIYAKASAGLNVNYRNRNWNLFFSYNYAHRKGINKTQHVRNFNKGVYGNEVYDQRIYATFPSDAHVPRFGADYTVNTKTTVGFQLSGMGNFINGQANNTTYVKDGNNVEFGSFATKSRTDNTWYNYNANVNLRHKLDSLGREFSADVDYSHYQNTNDQIFTTYLYDAQSVLQNESILNGDQSGVLDIYSVKADYVHPLAQQVKLELGTKVSYVTTDNELRYFNRIAEIDYPDSANSNHFIYSENINAAYLNANKEWEKLNVQAGLRMEQTLAKGIQLSNDSVFSRNYLQPFFSMATNYTFNDKNEAGLTISRRIHRPDYQQLNPIRRYVDKTTYGAGNPFLLPALTYSGELTYTYHSSLTFTLNYSQTKNDIQTVFLQDDADKITIQTDMNIERGEQYLGAINYSTQLNKWFQTATEIDVWQSKYSGTLTGVTLNRARPTFYINSTNTFILPKDFSVEVGGFYQHRFIGGILEMKGSWEADLGIQKKILKNKGQLKLNITDIFWKNNSSGEVHFANVNSRFLARHETRVATLSFSYGFGKSGAQVKKRSGAEEEKNRVKVG